MKLEVIQASDLPEPNTSYYKPWTRDMLYQVEPELEVITARMVAQKHRRIQARLDAYTELPIHCLAGGPVILGCEAQKPGTVSLTTFWIN